MSFTLYSAPSITIIYGYFHWQFNSWMTLRGLCYMVHYKGLTLSVERFLKASPLPEVSLSVSFSFCLLYLSKVAAMTGATCRIISLAIVSTLLRI